MMTQRICEYQPCSKPFTPARNNAKTQKYCSRSCRDRTQHIKHRETKNAKHRDYYAANRERLVAGKAIYTAANRDELISKQRARYEAKRNTRPTIVLICENPECLKQFLATQKRADAGKRFCSKKCRDRTFQQNHKEEILAYRKACYNKEEKLAYNKAYYKEHREERIIKDQAYHAAHREARNVYRRQHYRNNRAEALIKSARYHATHRKERDAYRRRYYAERYEEIMAYQIQYRETHREQMRLKDAAYRKANPEKVKSNLARYRARKASAPINDLTDTQWEEILAAYNHRCVYCHDTCWHCRRHKHALTQDHIIPLSKGGSHTASNIVPACKKCNSKKGNRAPLKPVQPLLLTIS